MKQKRKILIHNQRRFNITKSVNSDRFLFVNICNIQPENKQLFNIYILYIYKYYN